MNKRNAAGEKITKQGVRDLGTSKRTPTRECYHVWGTKKVLDSRYFFDTFIDVCMACGQRR